MKTQHEQRIEAVRQFREVWLLGVLRKAGGVMITIFGFTVAGLLILSFNHDYDLSKMPGKILSILTCICIAYVFIGGIAHMLNTRKILRECKRLGITYREWRTLKKNIK